MPLGLPGSWWSRIVVNLRNVFYPVSGVNEVLVRLNVTGLKD